MMKCLLLFVIKTAVSICKKKNDCLAVFVKKVINDNVKEVLVTWLWINQCYFIYKQLTFRV
ncbi:MAG: hypothetical protein COA86_09285 [Kangiella sp.]|nr:MAG: hypothetical protein COA86_09285 [Kangiella sp.]